MCEQRRKFVTKIRADLVLVVFSFPSFPGSTLKLVCLMLKDAECSQ